jgi:hypothetical protein
MTQQLLSPKKRQRPGLIVPIAVLAFAYALVLCACGGLSFAGRMSMRVAAQLLGSGLEVMGPAPYFLYAVALLLGTWGLLRAKNWGRRLLIVVCAVGVVLLVPHISSAVMDERYATMSFDGVQILVRVAIASYLFREAEWFVG